MKLKNTKYILLLLAGIMLATGCGCGDKGKGGAGGDVTELEATAKKLLDELEPLYMAWKKPTAGWGPAPNDEATAKKDFKKEYTNLESDSFVANWNFIKALLNKTSETGYIVLKILRDETCQMIDNIQNVIDNPTTTSKLKALEEKKLELYKNRLKMIDILAGV